MEVTGPKLNFNVAKFTDGAAVTGGIPPPPPPPPPPPLPSMVPATLKRKSDVTTPESEQLAKRTARITEAKTQFSITVEDLRSVKLRKTPAAAKVSQKMTAFFSYYIAKR